LTSDRHHPRFAITLEVEFRTSGSFLVAYSTNLSSGGMFVETPHPLVPGERITLKLNVPGTGAIEVGGVVAWSRTAWEEDKPPGMGVQFDEPLDARHGDMIDTIVSRFQGLRVVVLALDPVERARLASIVRSALRAARVVETGDPEAAETALAGADLAIVDLDDAIPEGLATLRTAKAGFAHPVPVVVTCTDAIALGRARELGADEVLANAAGTAATQAAILRALGRPARVT
jgi:uncharacterized protein (TIGR02266 family)